MAEMKRYKQILNIVLLVAAYGYLGYKILTYDNYAGLAGQFAMAKPWQYVCLLVCFMLFPLNRFFEACKWRYLVRGIEPMDLREAQRQVYYGTLAGFVTPYKIGEYPGRALLFRHTQTNWLSATCLGLIGGYAMTTVIVVAGLPSALLRLAPGSSMYGSLILALVGAVLAITALPAIMRRLEKRTWKNERTRLLVTSMAQLNLRDAAVLIGISLLRYLCFLTQLELCLLFCGVCLDPLTTVYLLPLYWLMITVTPNVPAAELAVRGAWAVALFERFGADVSAAAVIATMLLWTINTIPPLIIGSMVKRKLN